MSWLVASAINWDWMLISASWLKHAPLKTKTGLVNEDSGQRTTGSRFFLKPPPSVGRFEPVTVYQTLCPSVVEVKRIIHHRSRSESQLNAAARRTDGWLTPQIA